MKSLAYLFLPLLLLAGCAPLVYRTEAPNSDVERPSAQKRLLAQIGAQRPSSPVKGLMNGETVVIDYTPGDSTDCGTVLVTYQELAYSEAWEVCEDGRITRSAGEVGALPRSEEFIGIRHAVSMGAWKLGQAQALYADYTIFAASIGKPDENFCVIVENSVLQNERPLDVRHERVCGES